MSEPDHDPTQECFDNDGSYICDSCGEEIVIPLDPAGGHSQTYVEDCPVCCNPSVIHVDWDGAQARVWAESEQDRF
ncbi:CPXCG motif-containing cysteine-rich protein [Stieleria mannarensis]|uniref:CPXCG motif-containing cysteine-rich protein n=1 Tax=Stieleria mannarensis TaxID=2755585 RepID=UPI0016041F31|nr:CPXCG motif-containing cysteine-rich protein [Rhodopirellula sp. JC639]